MNREPSLRPIEVAIRNRNGVARKRALIRWLIEQNGWSSSPNLTTSVAGRVSIAANGSNVIPFLRHGK
jgi:hypothetical protein